MTYANEQNIPTTSQFFSARKPDDQTLDNSYLMQPIFYIEETVKWIHHNNYKRVALQLPDHFLSRALRIVRLIESRTDAKIFVLADTSYRSCCVDEVAAAHAFCDAIVHYGDACLSVLTENIPVKFVFGHFPLNLEAFARISEYLTANVTSPLILLTDACYSYNIDQLYDVIRHAIPNERQLYRATILDPFQRDIQLKGDICSLGRLIPQEFNNVPSAQLCFVGNPTSPLVPLWLLSFPQCEYMISFDPQSSVWSEHKPHSWRELRKRLFLVEKLRDARTVGLVVGSVGVKGHKEAVQRMREMCKTAEKRLYVISVNVPKLSNFVDIDVFVLLSCPFGVILDSTEFFRPVMSMFEAEVALNPLNKWYGNSKWCADFTEFTNSAIGAHDGDDASMSLITGSVRQSYLKTETPTEAGQLVPYAVEYFQNHSWHGLDDGVRLDQSTDIMEGRSGTALGYDIEPKVV
ncbi:diphthamide biosynthesis protein 2 [Dictyocaulus viviparus]|uniref:2-(3-amino-3-carboxypropyl)histidine synthase subunit 2 n=1 Tax=Dictyocaulus viviparus TaxID=29172 RepID=A0A0D8XZL3_DICVI|nr:diphthamide biosynthesis protein 2 [Dictyocaulus viviparus]